MNHIKCTTEENRAWCGKDLDTGFHFKDTEQAVINGKHGAIQPCAECVNMAIGCLIRSLHLGEILDKVVGEEIIKSWENNNET